MHHTIQYTGIHTKELNICHMDEPCTQKYDKFKLRDISIDIIFASFIFVYFLFVSILI